MEIKEYTGEKRLLMPLLLLADEEEAMVLRYLERGTVFVLAENGEICAECTATDEGGGLLEIKNIAVYPRYQGRGYGRALLAFTENFYRDTFRTVQVGTSPANIPFYEKCGFTRSHTIAGFFTQNYTHPIYENGILLTDMLYLKKNLNPTSQN